MKDTLNLRVTEADRELVRDMGYLVRAPAGREAMQALVARFAAEIAEQRAANAAKATNRGKQRKPPR